MMGRVITAYQVELLKALRWKYTYVGPVLVVLMVTLAPFVHAISDEAVGPYRFIAFATPSALNLLGLFLLISFSAGLVSTETASGTIRLLLTRPLKRHEFILAKLMTGCTYAVLLSVCVAIASWGLAAAFGRLTGVEYGGEVMFTSGYMLKTYVAGLLLSLAPQFAFVAYAVMISTVVKNTGAAVASAIGFWIVLDAVKYPLGFAPLLFATYLETPWEAFRSCCDGQETAWAPAIYWCLATSGSAILLFSAASMAALHRRNLQA